METRPGMCPRWRLARLYQAGGTQMSPGIVSLSVQACGCEPHPYGRPLFLLCILAQCKELLQHFLASFPERRKPICAPPSLCSTIGFWTVKPVLDWGRTGTADEHRWTQIGRGFYPWYPCNPCTVSGIVRLQTASTTGVGMASVVSVQSVYREWNRAVANRTYCDIRAIRVPSFRSRRADDRG